MISYEPMKRLMKERGIRNKDLIDAGLNPFVTLSLGQNIKTDTLDALCSFFKCDVSDLICFTRDCEEDVKINVNWEVMADCIGKSDMTFSSISVGLGKSKNWLYSKRNGNFKIKLSELKAICGCIGASVEEMVDD